MFSSQAALPSISARACVYIFAVSRSLSVSPGLSIKVDSFCGFVYLFHTAYQLPEHLVLLLDDVFEMAGASAGGDLCQRLYRTCRTCLEEDGEGKLTRH